MSPKKNPGGRPRSPDPKCVRVVVKMTAEQAGEAQRRALLDDCSVAEVLRRPLASPAPSPRSIAPNVSRRA
jgi:hypothetical protein